MPKRTSLSAALQEAGGKPKPEQKQDAIAAELSTDTVSAPVKAALPPSRQGKKAITGHFDPAVSKQLKQIGLEQDKSIQDLLAEALNDLFTKYGRSPIA